MALARAVEAHRAGRLEEAERAYRAVLAVHPRDVEALQLLGLVAHRRGRSAEALDLLERAVQLDPEHAVAHANLGLVLRALGRPEEANRSLERAVSLRPDLKEAWLNLARGRAALGDVPRAIQAAQAGARDNPAGLRLLAGLLAEAGRWPEAARALSQLVAGGARDPGLLTLLATALQECGEVAAAGRAWGLAAQHPEADGAAAAGLGAWLLREGRAEEAVPWLKRALSADPSRHALALALTDALSQRAEPASDEETLADLLERDGVDHQRLERDLTAALERLPAVAALIEACRADAAPGEALIQAGVETLLQHRLTQLGLTRLLVRSPAWERALSLARDHALGRAVAGEPLPRAGVAALAAHAWNTEFAAPLSPAADRLAPSLAARLDLHTLHAWADTCWDDLVALATIRPLSDLPAAEALGAPGWEGRPLAALVRQQIVEPAEERALQAEIPTLGDTGDPTSAAVRDMYEQSPYPRLVSVHRRAPAPLDTSLRTWLRRADLRAPEGRPLDVLVAGCGTGQHALNTATRTAEARVLAVDLSRPSLARASRLAAQHGVKNLRFAQADILGLRGLEQRFHVVESVGVLHHLDDPAAGLEILRDLLLPGGLMQVGLYSERGRQDVVAGRALIAAAGWPPTPDGVRAARAAIQALPADHPAAPLVRSPDFASLSGTRDLLFHVCERRFTPLTLAALLDGLDLELLGFQHPQPSVGALYRARFPEDPLAVDLARWDKLEDEHPRLFSGMFVFWCRRRAPRR